MNATKSRTLYDESVKLQQIAAGFANETDRSILTVSQNFNIGAVLWT
jgi:hypothetical protein